MAKTHLFFNRTYTVIWVCLSSFISNVRDLIVYLSPIPRSALKNQALFLIFQYKVSERLKTDLLGTPLHKASLLWPKISAATPMWQLSFGNVQE